MRTLSTRMWLLLLLCALAGMAGCCIEIGCDFPPAKYTRVVEVSAPLAAGGCFTAKTHNGSIMVAGADVAECRVTATIVARAGSEERAKKLTEQTTVRLEADGNKLKTRIDTPRTSMNQSVSVSLDATVPNQSSLELSTHNGAVKIVDIEGKVSATTLNGGITASSVHGGSRLRTSNGSITCKEASGDMQLRSHNGNICAAYAESASPVCDVSIVTHNGGIDFTGPPDFSAAVEVSTHNGSIRTDLPITVLGRVSRRKLMGTIGTGEGELNLETHNGSIKIRS